MPAAARTATIALVVLAGAGIAAASAEGAGWGRPFRLAPPQTTDITAAQIAFSPGGEAAVAFATQNEDKPAEAHAFVALRSAGGRVSAPRAVPGSQQVLGLGFAGQTLELLTGGATSGRTCCDSAKAIPFGGGRFGRARTLAAKLTGATVGWLTALPPTGLLAAIATDRGVWVAQSRAGQRFAGTRRLSDSAGMPWTLAAAAGRSGRTTVAWTETTGQSIGPNQIFSSTGTGLAAPRGSRAAVTVAAGHQIDELDLAPTPTGATAGWIESWIDQDGVYHAEVVASDLGAGALARAFPVSGQAESGLILAGNAHGDQVFAWKACDTTPTCTVWATVRRAGGRFGTPARIGAIDAEQDPAAAISPKGQALVGWIDAGHVRAAARSLAARAFALATRVSGTDFASNLTLSFGAAGQALAAWTQGTVAPDIVGAMYGSS
jgi:hypothetical protein